MASSRRKNRITKRIVRSAEKGNDKKSIRLTGRLGEIATREGNRAIGNTLAKRTLNKVVDPLRNAAGLPARSLTANAGVAFPKIQPKVDANGKIIPQGTLQSPATAVRTQRDQIVYNQTGKLPSSGMNSQNSGALEANIGPATIADATKDKGGTTTVRPAITPEKSVVDETFTEEDSSPTVGGGDTASLLARSSAPSALSTSGVGGGIFGGNANASVGGIQLNPDGTPALNSDFEYDLTPEQKAEADARKAEEDYYKKESRQKLDRQSIMRDAMRAFQGEIDAVNSVYADKISQARLEGSDRLGSDRAANFNAGAVNSTFGEASKQRVLEFNRGKEGAISNEKLNLISQINSAARAVGDKYYEQKKAAKEAGFESYMTSLKGSTEAKKAIAIDVAQNIFRANLSPEQIDKKQLAEIAKNAGVSVGSVESSFKDIVDKAEADAEAKRLEAEKEARDGQYTLSKDQSSSFEGISEEAKLWANAIKSGQYELKDAPKELQSQILEAMQGGTQTSVSPKQERAINQASTALSAFDAIFANPAVDGGALRRGIFKVLPGSNSKDLNESIKTIQALVGFDELQKMRDASPTGGALGQVSEREIDFLQALAGSLNTRQSDDQLLKNLTAIQTSFQTLKLINSADGTEGVIDEIPFIKSGDNLIYEAPDGKTYKRLPDGNLEETSFTKASSNTSLEGAINKIASIESKGNYQALGPVLTSGMYKGQRAVGKYQVMEGNIGPWSKEAFGQEVSVQDFYNNPQIQDAIIQDRFTKLYQQYGNWDDVASVWFSGRPLAKAGNSKDQLGTSVQQYVQNFNLA